MAITRLAGGSKSIASNNGNGANNNAKFHRIPMLRIDDEFPVFLSTANEISGYILPGFQEDLSLDDASRPTSVCPYRSLNTYDDETGEPAFTSWFAGIDMYPFFGVRKNTFISPAIVGMADPIIDLRKYCYGKIKRENRSDLKKYVERPKDFKNIWPLPQTTKMTVMNAVCTPTNPKEEDQSKRVRLLCLKPGATRFLQEELDRERPASHAEIYDAQWEDYLFGDITNPASCLEIVQVTNTTEGGTDFPCITFGKTIRVGNKKTTSVTKVPEELVRQYLPQRMDFLDTEKVLYIPSYDEIVKLLWQEEQIPHEILTEVCRDKCANWEYVTEESAAQAADNPAYSPATPQTPAPAPKVDDIQMDNAPAFTPPPAPPAVQYWVTDNRQSVLWDEAMLRLRVSHGWNGPVMKVGDTTWKTLADYGMAPAAPSPAPAPATPPAPAPQAMMPSSPSDSGSRTEEEEKIFRELLPRSIGGGNGVKLNPDEDALFKSLIRKAPFVG